MNRINRRWIRLEIELIELGRILDTNKLDYDSLGNLIVVYY